MNTVVQFQMSRHQKFKTCEDLPNLSTLDLFFRSPVELRLASGRVFSEFATKSVCVEISVWTPTWESLNIHNVCHYVIRNYTRCVWSSGGNKKGGTGTWFFSIYLSKVASFKQLKYAQKVTQHAYTKWHHKFQTISRMHKCI